MDLSCEENIQNSGKQLITLKKPMDMCTAGPDRALDRNPRLLSNLLNLQKRNALHTNYFLHVQIDIKPYMRKVVTTWMLEVCEEQQCEEQVFPLAVTYMDRFLAQRSISRKQLQLLAVASLLIASKFRQCHPLSIDLLCAYTDNSVIPTEVRQWEIMLMQLLNWQLSIPTAFDFIGPLLARVPWGRSNTLISRHALTLTSVCYTESDFFLIRPSVIAVACITSAARGLHVPMSVSDLCSLVTESVVCIEEVAHHVEMVLVRETQPLCINQVTPVKQSTSLITHIPTTPTDVQDVHF